MALGRRFGVGYQRQQVELNKRIQRVRMGDYVFKPYLRCYVLEEIKPASLAILYPYG